MSRIRITCKAPSSCSCRPSAVVDGRQVGVRCDWCVARESADFPRLEPPPASWEDVRVTLVADDGSEHDMSGVTSVSFSVREGEIAKATVTFLDPDVDLDAEVELPPTRPEAT